VKRTLAILAGALLLLTGCSSISEGEIVEKNHRDAYTYPVQYCAMFNTKTGGCSMHMTRFDTMPESWWFSIEKGGDEGWVYVGPATFEKYNVGDWYNE
jgi:uncharacterized protein YceK